MRRIGNLFPKICSFEHLLGASRLAMQGCGRTLAACRFFFQLETEILRLAEELAADKYRPGRYYFFSIFDPKPRTIAVAPFRDRVVHHAVVSALLPVYEPRFIHDSYATRPRKGTHAAILRAQHFARRWPWYLKADVEKYFDSVDHALLMRLLERKIKDRRLLALLDQIVRNAPITGKGLPIGNQTSQFLANVYLDPFDHYVKDRLRVPGYLRHMDDFVVFAGSKQELVTLKRALEEFLVKELALKLKPRATWINRSVLGVSFLGMRIFPSIIRIKPANRRRSLKRLRRMVGDWRDGAVDEGKMRQSITSIAGHLRYFCPKVPVAFGAGAT